MLQELNCQHITAVETLLKGAHLFHHIKNFNYESIIKCANKIYYNDGKNRLENINKDSFNKDKFIDFINDFDYVFTTNFDNVLDDAYQGEVCHLHGGFYYVKIRKSNGSISIVKSDDELKFDKAYLIWGRNSYEKEEQTQGGFSIPMSFPINFGDSILNNYFKLFKNGEFEELYIWGYSGLNDGHINNVIINICLMRSMILPAR